MPINPRTSGLMMVWPADHRRGKYTPQRTPSPRTIIGRLNMLEIIKTWNGSTDLLPSVAAFIMLSQASTFCKKQMTRISISISRCC